MVVQQRARAMGDVVYADLHAAIALLLHLLALQLLGRLLLLRGLLLSRSLHLSRMK